MARPISQRQVFPFQVATDQPEIVVQEPEYWFPPMGLDLTHRLSRLDPKYSSDITNLMLDDGVLRSRFGLVLLNSGVESVPTPSIVVFDSLQGSVANLVDHGPTNPGTSGWSAWEYNEPASAFSIWQYGGVIHDYFGAPGVHDSKTVARTNVAFPQTTLELSADVYRLAVVPIPQAGEGFDLCALVPNTVIGSYNSTSFIYGHMTTNNVPNKALMSIHYVDSSGVDVSLSGTDVEIDWPQGTGRQLIFEINSAVATWSDADYVIGTNKTLRATASVPSVLLGASHDRVGLKVYTTASWGFSGYNFRIEGS